MFKRHNLISGLKVTFPPIAWDKQKIKQSIYQLCHESIKPIKKESKEAICLSSKSLLPSPVSLVGDSEARAGGVPGKVVMSSILF